MASRTVPSSSPRITAASSSSTGAVAVSGTGYGNYGTPPSVTVTTGSTALITMNEYVYNIAAGTIAYASFAISGATSRASADTNAIITYASTSGYMYGTKGSYSYVVSGLTPGNNTFTMQERVSGGSCTIANRDITVISLS